MSRRLPVFFLLDVSESMAGDELYQMEEVVSGVTSFLKKDPHCLETVSVAVTVFAGQSRTLRKLTELIDFTPPELPIGGGTALGRALEHLMNQIDEEVVVNSEERRGDWKPLIFLITDGAPTDDPTKPIQRWKDSFASRSNLVAISMGGEADSEILRQFSANVFSYLDSSPDSYTSLVQWISLSIQSHSKSIASGQDGKVHLSKLDDSIFSMPEHLPSYRKPEHEKFISVVGRCEKKKHPYLIKYRYAPVEISEKNLPSEITGDYLLVGSTPLREVYFELTDLEAVTENVSLSRLLGQPSCPHCGSQISMAVDNSCGNIHCLDGEGKHMCPWCGETGEYFEVELGEVDLQANKGLG